VSPKTDHLRSLMTIYFITHCYHNPKTGGERYNFEVVKHLRSRGFDVRILVDKLMPKFIKRRRFLLYNFFYILKFLDVRRIVLFTTDYMHPRLFLLFLFLKLFKNCKIFVLVHHLRHHEIENRILKFLDIRLETIFLMCTDVVIAISKNTKSEIKQLTRKDKNIFVVYPGLDQIEFETTPTEKHDKLNLLFVGDCVRRKGLEYLIEGLSSLNQKNVLLHIVGRDDRDLAYSDYVHKLSEKKELQGKVVFHGRADGIRKQKLFRNSHIFVLPSLWEGYGMAVAEAMCYGLPIVATKVGAIPELVKDGVNGILVSPRDSQLLTEAISYLIENPLVREDYGKKSKFLSHSFNNWLQTGEQFVKIFEENIQERDPR
jgi:glycosyltransferase involved in cell wall biosynthesis